MIMTSKALTKEECERIAKEINEILKDDEHIANAEEIQATVIGNETTYIAFCKDCNLLYQPGTEEPITKVPIGDFSED